MKTKLLITLVIIISVGISIGAISQIDLYDFNKHHTVFGPGSPLAEIGTGNPVLTKDNCNRYAYWLTEHQKEKITLPEDFSTRYPPWGNQIFPLIDYCTKIGQFDKTMVNGMIRWEFDKKSKQMQGLTSEPEPEPSPEPEQMTQEDRLRQEKQYQAKLQTQKEIMIDYRGNQPKLDAINKYREEFESDYFLEQFVIPNKQNFEQDEVVNFVVVQWGYQPEKCISYNVKAYFKPYENYDPFYAEKISEWENAQECSAVVGSDSNGHVIVNIEPMPGIPEEHQTCTNPGEYRILVRNLKDEPQVEWGHYTCQRDKLEGEPQPWMEIPE